MDGEQLLTVVEACAVAGVSRPTLLGWIWDGRFPAKRLRRGAWHVRARDLDAWLHRPDNRLEQARRGDASR